MNDNYGEKFITFFLENWSLLGVHCHCHWGPFSVFGSPFFSISPFSLFQVLRTREKSVQPLSNVCLTEILVFLFISQNRMISVNMSKLHFWVPIDWFRSICPNFTFRSPLHVGAVGQTPLLGNVRILKYLVPSTPKWFWAILYPNVDWCHCNMQLYLFVWLSWSPTIGSLF